MPKKNSSETNIWYREISIDDLNAFGNNTLISHLGIRYTEVGADFLKGTMPVDQRTKQPAGILHGGASIVLAETLGSTAANLCIDRDNYLCVGLEINANHVRSMREGEIRGITHPLHLGSSTHIWDIRIEDAQNRLVCTSRITMSVLDLSKDKRR